ncbi:MAG TPA: SLC13 family permease [Bacillales bacterium]
MAKKIMILFSIAVYFVFISPVFFDWNQKVQAFALLSIAQVLWIGGIFPPPFTALLILLVSAFHFLPFDETLHFLGSEVVWLLFSMYLLAGSFLKSGLAYRLSLYILRLSRGNGKFLLLSTMVLVLTLSVFIPSNIGRGSLVASVLDKIAGHLNQLKEAKNMSKAFFIACSYIVSIGGAVVVTGANSTIYAFSMFNGFLSPNLSYLSWILLFAPPVLVFVLALWGILLWMYRPEKINSNDVISYIEKEIEQLGRVSLAEMKMMIIIGLTVLLWVLEPYHGYPISLIGMLGATATIFPVIGIWKWDEAKESINWEMLLFFASTLLLSYILIQTGSLKWVAGVFVNHFPEGHTWLLLITLIFGTLLLRLVFVSILGFMTIMIPLALVIGEHVNGISPVLTAMTVFLAGVPGFFLVMQSPVHMICFSYGHFSEKHLFQTGMAVFSIWIFIVLLTVQFYWRLIL